LAASPASLSNHRNGVIFCISPLVIVHDRHIADDLKGFAPHPHETIWIGIAGSIRRKAMRITETRN